MKWHIRWSGIVLKQTYADNELYRAILFDKMNINEGMLMEKMVAQMFLLCFSKKPRGKATFLRFFIVIWKKILYTVFIMLFF